MTTGQTFRNTLIVILTLVAFYILLISIRIIIVLLIAIIIASALRPIVRALVNRRIPFSISIILVYLSLAVFVILLGLVIIPPLVNQFAQYLENDGRLAYRIITAQRWVEGLILDVTDNEVSLVQPENIREAVSDFVVQFRRIMPSMMDDIGSTLSELVLIFVMGAYWLTSLSNVIDFITQLAPPRYRDTTQKVIDEIEATMGGYVRGIFLISLIVGLLNLVAMQVFGVPNAILLAFIIAITTTIPMIGGLLGGILAVLITLVAAPQHIVSVIVIAFIVQQIESYILSPRIMSETVGLDPLLVIVYTSIGFVMSGIIGALIAVPIMGTIHILLLNFVIAPYKKSMRKFQTQDGIPVTREGDPNLAVKVTSHPEQN